MKNVARFHKSNFFLMRKSFFAFSLFLALGFGLETTTSKFFDTEITFYEVRKKKFVDLGPF